MLYTEDPGLEVDQWQRQRWRHAERIGALSGHLFSAAVQKRARRGGKAVEQLRDGQVIATHQSIRHAAWAAGVSESVMHAAMKGGRRLAGCTWGRKGDQHGT